jgi:CRISPR-associated protein Csb1
MMSLDYDKGSGKTNPLSQEGFKYSLATETHGGVLVRGDIRQEAVINLVALRTLTADMNLKRYLLGLALVALSYRDQECFNLREGCLLCAASPSDYDGIWKIVNFNGTENAETISHDVAFAYAEAAVRSIRLEAPEPDTFDKEVAEAWLKIDKKKRKALAKTKHPAQAVEDEAKATTKQKNKEAKPDPISNSEASQ